MALTGLTITITGFKLMHGYEPASEIPRTQFSNYFTVQANTFMGMVAFCFFIL